MILVMTNYPCLRVGCHTFTLLACEKYMLEKFVISLHVSVFTIHPSTLALLRIIYLSFFNSLS
jgi:hypothetical protein